MDVGKQEVKFTTEKICIYWVVTWPREPGHSSTTEGHRNLLLSGLVEKGRKVSYAK